MSPTGIEPEPLAVACPTCGEEVLSYDHVPHYERSVEFYPGTTIPDPSTTRMVHVRGVELEWTLRPCGHQFYMLEFLTSDGTVNGRVVAVRERVFQ